MQKESLKDINTLVTIVIPTKNEEAAIGKVIDELHGYGFNNILVVDGFSTDNTVELAIKKGAKVIHQFGKGKTGALKTAIMNVNTPYMVVIDGDYTYDAKHIRRLLEYADSYGEVIGVRIPSDGSMTKLHKFGNKILTGVFNLMMGTNISDVCSGLYVLNTDLAKRLRFDGVGFDVEVEIAAQMATINKIHEIPINYRRRIGKEKLSTWRHGFTILSSIIRFAQRYNPKRFYVLLSLLLISIALVLSSNNILNVVYKLI